MIGYYNWFSQFCKALPINKTPIYLIFIRHEAWRTYLRYLLNLLNFHMMKKPPPQELKIYWLRRVIIFVMSHFISVITEGFLCLIWASNSSYLYPQVKLYWEHPKYLFKVILLPLLPYLDPPMVMEHLRAII